MCFTLTVKYQKHSIAERNIKCYKYTSVYSYTDEFNFRSECMHFDYTKNKIYGPTPFQFSTLFFAINVGYHSYDKIPELIPSIEGSPIVFKIALFIIPKGAKYYYNPKEGQYCSDQIIYKKLIKTIGIEP